MKFSKQRIADIISGIAIGGWLFWAITRCAAVPGLIGQLDGQLATMAFDIADDTLMPVFLLIPLSLAAIVLQCLPDKK
ncbi:MAG: hypothetical protein WC802_05800 [Patescibacteria group bacterium]|jgi:hypothetical protein